MTVRNQNYIHEETESKFTFSNACYTLLLNSVYFFSPPDYN